MTPYLFSPAPVSGPIFVLARAIVSSIVRAGNVSLQPRPSVILRSSCRIDHVERNQPEEIVTETAPVRLP
ncbi:hypothetical protein PMIN06_000799 [Paraphaeosphaeria minitans]